MTSKISGVIITYNEVNNIEQCILSIKDVVDEIIILDSDSTDGTLEICRKYNVIIVSQAFLGFGKQKQLAASLAKNNWVLSIDADEVLSTTLQTSLKEIDLENTSYSGFFIKRNHVFFKKIFAYGKENNQSILRLFNKEKGNFNDVSVHEKVIVTGTTSILQGTILHNSYSSVNHYFDKLNNYTEIASRELFKQKRKKSLILVFFSTPFIFFKNYIVDLNILNGTEGLLWSIFNTWYRIVKYVKLWEKHKK